MDFLHKIFDHTKIDNSHIIIIVKSSDWYIKYQVRKTVAKQKFTYKMNQ